MAMKSEIILSISMDSRYPCSMQRNDRFVDIVALGLTQIDAYSVHPQVSQLHFIF